MSSFFSEADLVDLVFRIFTHNGMSDENATIIARNCVGAERDGAKSHGLFRVPGYVADLKSGWVDGRARPVLESNAPDAIIRVDARNGFAQPALDAAREPAIDKARKAGACIIAIRDSHHFGALWADVEGFGQNGLVALAFANSVARMVPFGGRVPVYGTNPMAMAVPRANAEPVVFDQASSVIAFGDVLIAARSGHEVADDVGVDKEGASTTNPDAIIKGGSLLPFGGYKGSSIAMMVEVLGAALTGGNFSAEVDFKAYPGAQTPKTGELVILIDPARIGAREFESRIETLLARLKTSGQQRIPGQRRYENRQKALRDGIPLGNDELEKLKAFLT
jgi:delta1-piperideine-2-carboxylate reductase